MSALDLALHPWETYAACGGQNPALWETPSKRNGLDPGVIAGARRAIDICRTCPVRRECRNDAHNSHQRSVIRAGIAYDDSGSPVPKCNVCYEPVLSGDPRSRFCEKHNRYDLTRLGRRTA